MKGVLFSVILALTTIASAESGPTHGWRWYDDPEESAKEEKKPPQKAEKESKVLSPSEQLEAIQERYRNDRALAVIDPTVDNVRNVMKWHQFFLNKSERFGDSFKLALLQSPELSNRIEHPVESIARKAAYKKKKQNQEHILDALREKGYGLIFVFRGQDALSKTLAPSLVHFSERHGLPLLGVSQDGVLIDAIANSRVNDGRIQPKALPAIFLANLKTKQTHPVAYGFVSIDELAKNIEFVTTQHNNQSSY